MFESVGKVFVHDEAEMSRAIYVQSPSHSMGNHQSNIRFLEKLKFIVGLAHKIVQTNGAGHIQPVQGILASWQLGRVDLRMMQGQLHCPEELVPGYLNINRRYMYAALHWCTTQYTSGL